MGWTPRAALSNPTAQGLAGSLVTLLKSLMFLTVPLFPLAHHHKPFVRSLGDGRNQRATAETLDNALDRGGKKSPETLL